MKNAVPAFHKSDKVAAYRLAVGTHAVFALKYICNVLLTQSVILVRIFFQDVEDVDDKQFFRLSCMHGLSPFFCAVCMPGGLFEGRRRASRCEK